MFGYFTSVDLNAGFLSKSMADLNSEYDQVSTNPQVLSDPNWRADASRKATQFDKIASLMEGITPVPPQCVSLQQKIQQLCAVCHAAARDFANGATNANAEAMQKAMLELGGTQSLIESIDSEEKNLKARDLN